MDTLELVLTILTLAADLDELLPDPAAVAKLKRAVDKLYKLTHPPRVYVSSSCDSPSQSSYSETY
jgi:hypothetical protein